MVQEEDRTEKAQLRSQAPALATATSASASAVNKTDTLAQMLEALQYVRTHFEA